MTRISISLNTYIPMKRHQAFGDYLLIGDIGVVAWLLKCLA